MRYFRVFGSKCYIKRDEDLGKFDARSDEGIFLGYSTQSKAYRCFNKRLKKLLKVLMLKLMKANKDIPSTADMIQMIKRKVTVKEGKFKFRLRFRLIQ